MKTFKFQANVKCFLQEATLIKSMQTNQNDNFLLSPLERMAFLYPCSLFYLLTCQKIFIQIPH